MAAKPKINRERFIEMWERGDKVAVIAARFNIGEPTVSTVARRYGLKLRNPHGGKGAAAEPHEPEAPERSPLDPRPDFPESRDLALIEAGGKYNRIADLAAEWHLPMRNVLARWHRLRVAMKNTTKTPAVRKAKAQ